MWNNHFMRVSVGNNVVCFHTIWLCVYVACHNSITSNCDNTKCFCVFTINIFFYIYNNMQASFNVSYQQLCANNRVQSLLMALYDVIVHRTTAIFSLSFLPLANLPKPVGNYQLITKVCALTPRMSINNLLHYDIII